MKQESFAQIMNSIYTLINPKITPSEDSFILADFQPYIPVAIHAHLDPEPIPYTRQHALAALIETSESSTRSDHFIARAAFIQGLESRPILGPALLQRLK